MTAAACAPDVRAGRRQRGGAGGAARCLHPHYGPAQQRAPRGSSSRFVHFVYFTPAAAAYPRPTGWPVGYRRLLPHFGRNIKHSVATGWRRQEVLARA